MTTGAAQTGFAVEALGIVKHFAGVAALKGCDLRVRRGEIHALLGQNGAGKSTLVKIVNGVHPAGSFDGVLRVGGVEARFASVAAARRCGIGYVPQEIEIFERLSVAENIFAGQLASEGRVVDWNDLRHRAATLLGELGLEFDPAAPVATLSAAERHLVMIARALAARPVLLVLDEPTASLSEREIEALFALLRRLREQGSSMIYITHRLPEVLAICDRASVLRDGVITAEFDAAQFDVGTLVREMSGRSLGTLFPERSAGAAQGAPLLAVERLMVRVNGRTRVDAVSFEVRAGEILGLAGLLGAGRTELMSALAGALPHSGEVRVAGAMRRLRSPGDARAAGIVLLTEDRKRSGLLFNLAASANITIGNLKALARLGIVDAARERGAAVAAMARLAVRSSGPDASVAHLSGGNQQKLLLARIIMARPAILLLDDPSKGVDAATRQEIYRLVAELAQQGCAVIVTSSEIEEVVGLADRSLVMTQGRIVGEVRRGEADPEAILHMIAMASNWNDATQADVRRTG